MPIRALVNDEFRNQASSARTVRATTPHKIAAALFAAAYAARNGALCEKFALYGIHVQR
jgi:hypothetical protein